MCVLILPQRSHILQAGYGRSRIHNYRVHLASNLKDKSGKFAHQESRISEVYVEGFLVVFPIGAGGNARSAPGSDSDSRFTDS